MQRAFQGIVSACTVVSLMTAAIARAEDAGQTGPTLVKSANESIASKVTDVLEATFVTSRLQSELGVVHRGCDFPTLICHHGVPEVCLQESAERCNIETCIVKHEAKHIEDIAVEHIGVCEGRKDGQLAQTPLGQKVLLERSAIKVEQGCLQGLLRQSEGDCRRRISERLKRIAQFDSNCVQGAKDCKSPLVPFNPKEMVTLCSW